MKLRKRMVIDTLTALSVMRTIAYVYGVVLAASDILETDSLDEAKIHLQDALAEMKKATGTEGHDPKELETEIVWGDGFKDGPLTDQGVMELLLAGGSLTNELGLMLRLDEGKLKTRHPSDPEHYGWVLRPDILAEMLAVARLSGQDQRQISRYDRVHEHGVDATPCQAPAAESSGEDGSPCPNCGARSWMAEWEATMVSPAVILLDGASFVLEDLPDPSEQGAGDLTVSCGECAWVPGDEIDGDQS